MAKDPAFLFYDGDAARDVSHMNRLERGAYFDIIQAQRKFHGITVDQIRKILGKDFEQCWAALEMVLSVDENGKYFIEWIRESELKRSAHAELNRKRIQSYWDKKNGKSVIPRNNHGNTEGLTKSEPLVNEIENENAIENENRKRIVKEKPKIQPPDISEWIVFWKDEGYSPERAATVYKSYSENGWRDTNQKEIRNWKMKCRQVWFKPENKIKNEINQRNPVQTKFSGRSKADIADL
jgi:hypothetical protein